MTVFIVADATYSEDILRSGRVDGVTFDPELSKQTLRKITEFASSTPTIILPSHDPDARRDLPSAAPSPDRESAGIT